MLHLARNIVGNSLQLSKMSACGHTYVQMGSKLQLPGAGARNTHFLVENVGKLMFIQTFLFSLNIFIPTNYAYLVRFNA